METASFDGAHIEFPVTFDLKFIYESASAATINADLLAVFARRSVPCVSIETKESKPGARYGRLAARVTFTSLEQLRETYEELGKLSYVKGLI